MKRILSVFALVFALVCVLASCDLPFLPGTGTTPEGTTPEETTPAGTTPVRPTPDDTFPTSQGLTYEENWDGVTCTVRGIGTCTDEDIYIGGYIDGYKVTGIDGSAFYGSVNLMSVTIGNSVTEIGESAFSNCTNLINVTIGDAVTTIGSFAFNGCQNLKSVTIGNSVTTIDEWAFDYCLNLVEVINKSSLDITVGSSEHGGVALYAKEVHNGATKMVNLNDYLFYTCDGANYLLGYVGTDTVLNLPETYNGQNYEIYQYAFSGRTNLASVTVSNYVTGIGADAFSGCGNLASVTIGNSVTTIGEHAFLNCANLTSITIPDSVNIINRYAFEYCESLTSIIFANPNGWNHKHQSDAPGGTSISATEFSDDETAAQLLVYDLNHEYWYRLG